MIHVYHVVEDDGEGQKLVDLHVDAKWSFWKVSGACFIPISMQMDRPKGEVLSHHQHLTLSHTSISDLILSEVSRILDTIQGCMEDHGVGW